MGTTVSSLDINLMSLLEGPSLISIIILVHFFHCAIRHCNHTITCVSIVLIRCVLTFASTIYYELGCVICLSNL